MLTTSLERQEVSNTIGAKKDGVEHAKKRHRIGT
jgi:hypothetical protein